MVRFFFCGQLGTVSKWVFQKKIWVNPPKMDGENNGNPYEQMDDLGGFPPLFLG